MNVVYMEGYYCKRCSTQMRTRELYRTGGDYKKWKETMETENCKQCGTMNNVRIRIYGE